MLRVCRAEGEDALGTAGRMPALLSGSVMGITSRGAISHVLIDEPEAKLSHLMNEFSILTNRKRALIALVHSVVFLGIAMHGFASPKAGVLLPGLAATADIVLIVIYLTVASILIWLVGVSGCAKERAYFVLCACSATFGLLRTIFGDVALPVAQYLRVIMLLSAVAVGTWIFRSFSRPVAEEVLSD